MFLKAVKIGSSIEVHYDFSELEEFKTERISPPPGYENKGAKNLLMNEGVEEAKTNKSMQWPQNSYIIDDIEVDADSNRTQYNGNENEAKPGIILKPSLRFLGKNPEITEEEEEET